MREYERNISIFPVNLDYAVAEISLNQYKYNLMLRVNIYINNILKDDLNANHIDHFNFDVHMYFIIVRSPVP